ncbi:MAG: dihydroorotate dehydrogenase electron transfer subunit [Eubacterium sp.]|nr:dihydroorotate dehydrogenase electron transfer subunit [Eubacterium sp.]
MAVILNNICVAPGIYKMDLAYPEAQVGAGQFFMLRAWDKDPLLSRPISVHNYEDGCLTFLYQVVGKGTEILAALEPGDDVKLQGPYGNGFPDVDADLVVVGGGIGVAPLYYVCRDFKAKHPDKKLRVYLGFRDTAYQVEAFERVADEVIVDIGGIVTHRVEANPGEVFFTCGPEIMMKSLCEVVPSDNPVYVSLEAHMACGIGACLGCTCKTSEGNKKVCKDGPVFTREVAAL